MFPRSHESIMLTYCGYEYYAYASLFVLRIRLIIFMTSICRVIILCLLLSYIQKHYAYCHCLLLALNVAWEGPLDCTLISQQHALRNNDWTTSYTTAIHMTTEPVSDKNNTKPYCYSCTLMACNSRRSVKRHGARKIQRRLQLRPRASLPLQNWYSITLAARSTAYQWQKNPEQTRRPTEQRPKHRTLTCHEDIALFAVNIRVLRVATTLENKILIRGNIPGSKHDSTTSFSKAKPDATNLKAMVEYLTSSSSGRTTWQLYSSNTEHNKTSAASTQYQDQRDRPL